MSLISTILAQEPETIDLQKGTGDIGKIVNQLTISNIISGLIRLTLVVAAILFFFMLVIGGIRWIASGGDKTQTEAARSQITAALIGLVVVFAAWAIAALIGTLFGVEIFNLEITSFQSE